MLGVVPPQLARAGFATFTRLAAFATLTHFVALTRLVAITVAHGIMV
jgi:hypothetical protein